MARSCRWTSGETNAGFATFASGVTGTDGLISKSLASTLVRT
ncbi:hypothetical protein [Ensifer sp. ZNC0028]